MKVGSYVGLLAFVLMSACSPYVRRGEALYHEGRYVEAAEVFELTEQDLAQSSPTVRAEYSLYRGLTYLRLDDLASARVWLTHANALEHANPGMLSSVQREAMTRATAELDHRRTSPANASPPTRFAASEEPSLVQRPQREPAGTP